MLLPGAIAVIGALSGGAGAWCPEVPGRTCSGGMGPAGGWERRYEYCLVEFNEVA